MKKLFYSVIAILLVSCTGKQPVDLNVMTYNIRYDAPMDSLDNWQYRKDAAAQVIKERDVDIVGLQEVLVNQLGDLKDRLPQYNSIGVGRIDGIEAGEYSPILYKKDRFKEINSGYFWLSETPEVVGSKGWDGACERIATWAVLEDNATGKQIFAINTHLDHIGQIARQQGVTLLLDRANELGKGLPVILTGDFNATPQSDVIKHVTDPATPGYLVDSKMIADSVAGTDWTFHGFGRVPLQERTRIDYIFVSDGINVASYEVLPEKSDSVFLSDHTPVIVRLGVK